MKTSIILILCATLLLTGCQSAGTVSSPAPESTVPQAGTDARSMSTIQYPEKEPVIRLSYDPALAGNVEGGLVPAVPEAPDTPYWTTHPAYVQLRFAQFANALPYEMLPTGMPQIMVFQARDFSGYGGEAPTSFTNQLAQLQEILNEGIDPARCAKAMPGAVALPFLPMQNSVQVFCAQAKTLEFPGGKGIRYVTYYDQGPAPKVDSGAFYTFQGLSDDGQLYISAVFPVRTNVLPAQPPAMTEQQDVKVLSAVLQEQVAQINAQPEASFTPSLASIDALIAGLEIPSD